MLYKTDNSLFILTARINHNAIVIYDTTAMPTVTCRIVKPAVSVYRYVSRQNRRAFRVYAYVTLEYTRDPLRYYNIAAVFIGIINAVIGIGIAQNLLAVSEKCIFYCVTARQCFGIPAYIAEIIYLRLLFMRC